jgi:hypothetical protein
VTFLNNWQDAEFDQSSLTFAHEVGHNFGAMHDETFEACNNTGFIMAGVSTNDGNICFFKLFNVPHLSTTVDAA